MFIKNIELNNFRNYENIKVDFSANKTILIGKNAQGKSNLLEAIYYIASLSSNRNASDKELIKIGSDFTRIKADLIKADTNIKAEIVINPPKKKVIKLNNLKKNKYSDFLGSLIVVNFGITDLDILRGNPSDRRSWLDNAISQLYPHYRDRLSRYNKVREQRNNVLKSFKGNINLTEYQKDFLSVWDQQLINSGSNIVYLRLKYIKEIQKIAFNKHKYITLDEENLLINYNSTVIDCFNSEKDEIPTVLSISENFKEKLKEKLKEEIIRNQTLIGPHRDDLSFFINERDCKNFASQGQQRTIVLALKISELDLIRDVIKENPVLLLDDVLAELDKTRQNYLLSVIKDDIQTIITTVDISNFEKSYLDNVGIYNIKKGTIT